MKRYLLLASVAGCLLSAGNAMADNTFGASATMNQMIVLTKVQNLSFGTIIEPLSFAAKETQYSISYSNESGHTSMWCGGHTQCSGYTIGEIAANKSITKDDFSFSAESYTLTNTEDSSKTIVLDNLKAVIKGGGTRATIGGRITFPANHVAGTYTGAITITANN